MTRQRRILMIAVVSVTFIIGFVTLLAWPGNPERRIFGESVRSVGNVFTGAKRATVAFVRSAYFRIRTMGFSETEQVAFCRRYSGADGAWQRESPECEIRGCRVEWDSERNPRSNEIPETTDPSFYFACAPK